MLGVNLFTYLAWGDSFTEERNFVNIGNAFLLLFQVPKTRRCHGDETVMSRRCHGDVTAMSRRCHGDERARCIVTAMRRRLFGACVGSASAVLSSPPHSLFQCLTGDGWAAMMMDSMITEETGRCTVAEGNCGTPIALPYFVSFQVIGCYVFLNLIVAVMLDTFTSLGHSNPNLVSAADVATFTDLWADFDPDADQMIPETDLPELVRLLPPPMGIKGRSVRRALFFLMKLPLQSYEGEVRFQEVLDALVKASYNNSAGFTPPSASILAKMKARTLLQTLQQALYELHRLRVSSPR